MKRSEKRKALETITGFLILFFVLAIPTVFFVMLYRCATSGVAVEHEEGGEKICALNIPWWKVEDGVLIFKIENLVTSNECSRLILPEYATQERSGSYHWRVSARLPPETSTMVFHIRRAKKKEVGQKTTSPAQFWNNKVTLQIDPLTSEILSASCTGTSSYTEAMKAAKHQWHPYKGSVCD